jgi:hypothetical protein
MKKVTGEDKDKCSPGRNHHHHHHHHHHQQQQQQQQQQRQQRESDSVPVRLLRFTESTIRDMAELTSSEPLDNNFMN